MKVNVCLTSIYDNLGILEPCLFSLCRQTRAPDKIVLCLSTEPYLLDKGFPNFDIPNWLKELPIEILWTENTGPFRKLLPLLERLWNSDEIIITVDDDTVYNRNLVETMVAEYEKTGCCIACRCTYSGDPLTNEYTSGKALLRHVYNYHTGKGAVLYHPSMFKRVGATDVFDKAYMELCPTADDHWFNLWRMYNGVECVALKFKYMMHENTNKELSLYHNFNEERNVRLYRSTADYIFSRKI